MPIVIDVIGETDHFLPEDRTPAHEGVLFVLHSPGDTYIGCFGFSDNDYATQVITADALGVNISIACDKREAATPTCRPILQRIVDAFAKRGKSTVTITTAGPLSNVPGEIYHNKIMVSKATDGGEDYCVEGSTNFTHPACSEANTLRIFRNNVWAAKAISDHIAVCQWANTNHPDWQLKPTSAAPVVVTPGAASIFTALSGSTPCQQT